VFGTYQTTINNFLLKFNGDFRIEALKPSDARGRGMASSTYELVINENRVSLVPAETPEPSFRICLSAGDRTTLALAFFFATLLERPSLNGSVVVLDDPASSLDDGRAFATAQEIRSLLGRASQVMVMSHSTPLLCQL